MAKTIRAFDFDIDISGAAVVVRREPLMSRCTSPGEIDFNIAQLKANLDALAVEMKAALRKQASQTVF